MSFVFPQQLALWRHPVSVRFIAWVIASLVTALIGPFTTYGTFAFMERLAYWSTVIGASIVMAYAIRALVLAIVPTDGLRSDIFTSIGQSLSLGTAIWAFNHFVLGFELGTFLWWLEHVGVVFAVCVAIVLIRAYMRPTNLELAPEIEVPRRVEPVALEPAPVVSVAQDAPQPPAFLRALEEDLGADLHYVSADDHYLKVATANGHGRVLSRFRDALEDLAEIPGYRIHRSHWVARAALVEVRQCNRRHYAVLRDGTELPVSKAHLEQLRDDGWLD